MMHERGIGTQRYLDKAINYYQGEINGKKDSLSELSMGRLYERGLGVDKDLRKARHAYVTLIPP